MPQHEAVQQQNVNSQPVRIGAQQGPKVEKIQGALTEEQRKQNLEKFSKLGIPSIAGLRQKEQQLAENDAQKASLQRNTAFDDPAFKHAWETVCAKIKSLDKDNLFVSLTAYPYEIDFSTYLVKITIDNKTQEQILNKEKGWVLEDLRNLLQNDQVNFDIAFTQDTNSKPQLYTQKDKFMKMAEKNPSLIYLTKKFGLDL